MSEKEKNINETAEETAVNETEAVENKEEKNVPEEAAEESKTEAKEEEKEVTAEADTTEEPEAEVKEEEVTTDEPVAEVKEEESAEEAAPEKTETPAAEAPVKEAVDETSKPEEFDWDSLGKKQDSYSKSERANLEERYEKTMSSITEHEVIEGKIVSISAREVVVNIGYKSDGVLPFNE
ncbi:MAG: hypothetical protein P8100_08860, partial [bacterium]